MVNGIVLFPIRAMTRNEDKYPKPDTFMPERFIDEHGNLNDDDMMLVFGFGRRSVSQSSSDLLPSHTHTKYLDRICPGRHMASATVR